MIRPLEYCINEEHFRDSIATIEQRIQELVALKNLYTQQSVDLNETASTDSKINTQEEVRSLSSAI